MLDLDRGNKHGGAREDEKLAKVAVNFKGCLLKSRRHVGLDYTEGKVTPSLVFQDRVLVPSAVCGTSYFTCFIVATQFGWSTAGINEANTHSSVDLLNIKLKLNIY